MDMNTIELYKTAIGIVASAPDFESICVEIAKNNPKAFVEAAVGLGFGDRTLVEFRIKDEARKLRAGSKIAAVKFVREKLGLGLKEAVDYVDSL